MSDTWYRRPMSLPPYEDGFGNLWTWDGVCLNPVHGCERPAWHDDLWMVDLQANLMMTFFEKMQRAEDALLAHRQRLGMWPAWRCPRCGSDRWVAASLTGPVSHGGRAIKQCIPCGHYSGDPVED